MTEASATVPAQGKAGFSMEPGATHALPRTIGRLLLLKLVARGGMGDIYLAATTGLEGAERPCIVKTVRRDHIHDGSFLARFLDEARVQAQLNHPGVAQVLEAATDDGGEPFTVVEYVEGRSLAEVRQRALQVGLRIGWADAIAIAIEMAQALAHVHERTGADGTPLGIVHRDLSPQNVMVGFGGDVKLIDFGTARGQNRRCHTVAGVVFAKPGYVAPEVARQEVGDGRIDVYALGIMLWEMCKGGRFLTGDPQRHLEEAAAGKTIVPKIAKTTGAPLALDDVIHRLTANDPGQRYASAGLAALDMAKLLAEAPPIASGERGVRARTSALMRSLWPQEPSRSRAEFDRLLREARAKIIVTEPKTPQSAKAEAIAAQLEEDPSLVAGTPYRIVRTVGEGSTGLVYEAEHVELGRRVALKVLSPAHASAPDSIERFRREARAVAKLSHPNLVPLYDFGKSLDGRVFLAMELLAGEPLDKRLSRTAGMDFREGLGIAIETCRALEAAHAAGLVHRDLKPANLFLTKDGGLKLLDFGVATALADAAPAGTTQKGFAVFGTPEYMSPEQVAGEAVDGRSDIYALGCVLYELLTGCPVFEGSSSVIVMGKQLRETPESPRARAPQRAIPAEIDAIVMRTLEKSPDARFASATALREALESTLRRPAERRARQKRWVVSAVAVALAIGVVGAARPGTVALAPTPVEAASVIALPPTVPAPRESEQQVARIVPTGTVAASVEAPPAEADTRHPLARETPSRAEREHALLEARDAAKGAMNDPRVLRAWAFAALRAGAPREARRAADAWILVDSGSEPHVVLAEALDAMGHRNEARSVLAEVLEAHPDAMQARKLAVRYGMNVSSESTRGQLARR